MLTNANFDGVTMDDIATAANVSRATLYNHFIDKAAILDAGFAEEFEAGCPQLISNALEISSRHERLEFVFEAFAEWAMPKKSVLAPAIAYGMRQSLSMSEHKDPLQAFFVCLLRNPKSPYIEEARLDELAHYLRHQYLAATLRWLASAEPNPRPYFSEMLSLFLYGSERKRNKL